MKNIPIEVKKVNQLPECWMLKNRKYLHLPNQLPTVPLWYKQILSELEISYRMSINWFSEEIFEYWDKEQYSEHNLTLPLYIPTQISYKYVKNHTGGSVTKETVTAAKALTEIIELTAEIEGYNEGIKISDILYEKKAIVVQIFHFINEDIFFKEEHLKIVPVKYAQGSSSDYYAIFNVNKINLNDEIYMEVPAEIAGLVIGKSAWQVKNWCQKLGLKRINVVKA